MAAAASSPRMVRSIAALRAPLRAALGAGSAQLGSLTQPGLQPDDPLPQVRSLPFLPLASAIPANVDPHLINPHFPAEPKPSLAAISAFNCAAERSGN